MEVTEKSEGSYYSLSMGRDRCPVITLMKSIYVGVHEPELATGNGFQFILK